MIMIMESRLQGCRSVQPSFCINRNYAENNTNTRIFRKKIVFYYSMYVMICQYADPVF